MILFSGVFRKKRQKISKRFLNELGCSFKNLLATIRIYANERLVVIVKYECAAIVTFDKLNLHLVFVYIQ